MENLKVYFRNGKTSSGEKVRWRVEYKLPATQKWKCAFKGFDYFIGNSQEEADQYAEHLRRLYPYQFRVSTFIGNKPE